MPVHTNRLVSEIGNGRIDMYDLGRRRWGECSTAMIDHPHGDGEISAIPVGMCGGQRMLAGIPIPEIPEPVVYRFVDEGRKGNGLVGAGCWLTDGKSRDNGISHDHGIRKWHGPGAAS